MKYNENLYIVDFANPSGTIRIGEFDVPLPAMPPEKYMVNYNKKSKDQFFQRTYIPDTLRRRKPLNEEEERFILNEYHKRWNGEWQLINGKPYYFPGSYYHFMNYWTTQRGGRPDFLYQQLLIYQFKEFCNMDENCYGIDLVKPRRIGGTETTLHDQYDFASRYRNVNCGMQSKNEKSVFSNYNRLLKGHNGMIWFMKPINLGSSANKEGLFLSYPAEQQTAKRFREIAEAGEEAQTVYEDPEIGSQLTYMPCIATAYDGEILHRYTLNEYGKLENMGLKDAWDKVKPCLHLDNGKKIIGKAMFESTIEEINDDQIQEVKELWDESDPAIRDENGRTESGLYRLFISALDAAESDEYGFPKREETLKFLENQFEVLKKKGKYKELGKLKRKTPLTIEDALTPSGNQSAFNTENLTEALNRIDYPAEGDKSRIKTIRGNFIWDQGVRDSRVVFDPHPDGNFVVSNLDVGEYSPMAYYQGQRMPRNYRKFVGGVDPFDHKETTESKQSKGAFVIMRKYDDLLDGAKFDEDGNPEDLALNWESDRVVCHYLGRPDDPNDFFEDCIKAAVFYGCQMLFENNKNSIRNYFSGRGYSEYIMKRPEGTISAQSIAKQTDGAPATEATINQYFEAIASYVSKKANNIVHRELILDLLELNRANRTKHDLGVAFGWALIASTKEYSGRYDRFSDESVNEEWFDEITI